MVSPAVADASAPTAAFHDCFGAEGVKPVFESLPFTHPAAAPVPVQLQKYRTVPVVRSGAAAQSAVLGVGVGVVEGADAVTVTVAVALFDVSATLVATTWYVPEVEGAV